MTCKEAYGICAGILTKTQFFFSSFIPASSSFWPPPYCNTLTLYRDHTTHVPIAGGPHIIITNKKQRQERTQKLSTDEVEASEHFVNSSCLRPTIFVETRSFVSKASRKGSRISHHHYPFHCVSRRKKNRQQQTVSSLLGKETKRTHFRQTARRS